MANDNEPRKRSEIPDDEWEKFEWWEVTTLKDAEPVYVRGLPVSSTQDVLNGE